ncbi:MAG: SH3 domain-containing protein [Proteobacteria bacterium]|nr:SH3 domain-containing protein [Pseudomonadota bacterium]
MRNLTALAFVLTLAGCGAAETEVPAEPEAPAEVAEAKADASLRYVLASRLNLREEPGGTKVGRLKINSPVTILEEDGENVKIRVQNGKEGWVPMSFLVPEPIHIPGALEKAKAAATAKERLAWTQRASALDFRHRGALEALAAAYRESGDAETAARIDSQLEWPDNILLAGDHTSAGQSPIVLEWGTVPWESYEQMRADDEMEDRDLSAAEMRSRGVNVGDPVWVLPNAGPAVQGKVQGMRMQLFNECGGTFGYVLIVNAELPSDQHAIAYTIEDAPKSWKQPAPSRDTAAAEAAVRKLLPKGPAYAFHAAAYADGVRVRVGWEKVSEEEDMPMWSIRDYQVYRDGKAAEVGRMDDVYSYIGYSYPAAGRDIDGDGRLDMILEGECMAVLQDADGVTRASSEMLCCGC